MRMQPMYMYMRHTCLPRDLRVGAFISNICEISYPDLLIHFTTWLCDQHKTSYPPE